MHSTQRDQHLQEFVAAKLRAPDAETFVADCARKMKMSASDAKDAIEAFAAGKAHSRLSELEAELATLNEDIRFYRNVLAQPMGRGFWCEAVEAQLIMHAVIKRRTADAKRMGFPEVSGLYPAWSELLGKLDKAEAYAWAADPIRACWHAAQSVPDETMLRRDDAPVGTSGWWYLGPSPLPVNTTDAGEPVTALFWKWVVTERGELATNSTGGATLHFCTVVMRKDEAAPIKTIPLPTPTEGWWWSEGETLAALQHRIRQTLHERADYNGAEWTQRVDSRPPEFFSDLAVGLSRFFIAGSAWLRQKVVTETSGHIERHRRKQMVSEYKLDAVPTVRVIELRRASYVSSEPSANDGEKTAYQCRWVVSGHWRNQSCGPHHSERKLIYIDAFVKGPSDAPLRVPSQQTVYAVRR